VLSHLASSAAAADLAAGRGSTPSRYGLVHCRVGTVSLSGGVLLRGFCAGGCRHVCASVLPLSQCSSASNG
jgi:hypothetical protein